jgi:phosphoenolpyruvate carboxykinase (ATP)
MSIAFTRRLLRTALEGALDDCPVTPHPFFKVLVPISCRGVTADRLDPRATWSDQAAYDAAAKALAGAFEANFIQYDGRVPREVAAAGPSAAL